MTMDDDYLTYPNRGRGQDHSFYDWSEMSRRKKLDTSFKLKEGKNLAVSFIVPVEFFPLNPSSRPFKHPGAMVTPYPDLRHFTVREYGNRVGVYRILEAFSEAGLKATFAVNGEIANRFPPLIKAIQSAGHEIAAHGLSTDHIHHEGLNEEEERDLISKTLSSFETPPKGWLSPARNQSSRTLELLAEVGLEYCLDWENDRSPLTFKTRQSSIVALPHLNELSDFNLLINKRQTEWNWYNQLTEAMDYLSDEAERFGPASLAVTLTPYVIGQPFRISQLLILLKEIANEPHLWIVPAGDVSNQYKSTAP